MAKLLKGAQLQFLKIDKSNSMPVYRQVEDQLRRAILSGLLRPSVKLPASRILAQDLGLSRPTIVQVYEYLTFEGFLESQHGSGTFVSDVLPNYIPNNHAQQNRHVLKETENLKPLSKIGMNFQQLDSLDSHFDSCPMTAFMPGVPAIDQFPYSRWQRIRNKLAKDNTIAKFAYESSAGYFPLRCSIAEYLAVHRGDQCDPEQILIVPGTHFAIHLATMLLSNPGDKIWLEDPGPANVRTILNATDRVVVDIDVEHDGMDVDGAMCQHGDARIAFTMPSRQHPLGATLSLSKRLKLLEWAHSNKSWIIEDDYDSEFSYSSRPLSSMRSIDTTQSVIYVGTFSKSLLPSLRIAYLVLPRRLIGTFSNAIGAITRSVSPIEQATLANFINEGHFTAYIRQMNDLYNIRQAMFCQEARLVLSGLLDVDTPKGGINTIGWLPSGTDDSKVFHAAQAAGIYCYPLSMFRVRPSDQSGLLLGFACVEAAEMKQKLTLLATVLEAMK